MPIKHKKTKAQQKQFTISRMKLRDKKQATLREYVGIEGTFVNTSEKPSAKNSNFSQEDQKILAEPQASDSIASNKAEASPNNQDLPSWLLRQDSVTPNYRSECHSYHPALEPSGSTLEPYPHTEVHAYEYPAYHNPYSDQVEHYTSVANPFGFIMPLATTSCAHQNVSDSGLPVIEVTSCPQANAGVSTENALLIDSLVCTDGVSDYSRSACTSPCL